MRASWILFLLTVLKSWSFSGVQAQPFESGARARALGGVRVVGDLQAGTPWGVGSIALRQAGFEQYKEVQIGVGWSYRFQMPFQTQLAIGVQGYRRMVGGITRLGTVHCGAPGCWRAAIKSSSGTAPVSAPTASRDSGGDCLSTGKNGVDSGRLEEGIGLCIRASGWNRSTVGALDGYSGRDAGTRPVCYGIWLLCKRNPGRF